jgi:hypothetical protein
MTATNGQSGDDIVGVALLGLRLEMFPLFDRGGGWQDLALFTTAGAGFGGAFPKDDQKTLLADGGSMRALEVGVFWEPLQWWHFSFGPELKYSHMSSDSMAANLVTIGFRSTFYGTQK